MLIVIRVASPCEVSALCLGVSLTHSRENASIENVEHRMCGESWLAVKDLQPTHPSSQGWASSVSFFSSTIVHFHSFYSLNTCSTAYMEIHVFSILARKQ